MLHPKRKPADKLNVEDLPVEKLVELWSNKPCEFTLEEEIEACRREGIDPSRYITSFRSLPSPSNYWVLPATS